MEISVYPGTKLNYDTLEACRRQAIAHGIKLETVEFGEFRRTFSLPGYRDSESVQRVYQACKIAHVWGCHAIQEGYFYKCPQSIYIPQILGWPADAHTADGIKITDSPGFLEDLHRYLTSPDPLQSCRHCLDSHGKRRDIVQVRPRDWLAQHDEPAEAILDYKELQKNEQEMGIIRPDDIKTKIDQYSN